MNNQLLGDPYFKVVSLANYHPSQTQYIATKTCYSEKFYPDHPHLIPDAATCDEKLAELLLANKRGHWSPIEHGGPYSFAIGFYGHTVMQQLRTHRVGVSFSVQSGRYTGSRIEKAASGELNVEEVFYVRQPGIYRDRTGHPYNYSLDMREEDLLECLRAAKYYSNRVEQGVSEEHARNCIPYAIRQHMVVTFNLRSLFHVIDLRAKADAELEIQDLSARLFTIASETQPSVVAWYEKNRYGKAILSP